MNSNRVSPPSVGKSSIRERGREGGKAGGMRRWAGARVLGCSLSGGVHLVSLFLPRIPARRPPSDVYEGDRGPRK